MSTPAKTPRPQGAPFDSQFEKEESRVRNRSQGPSSTAANGGDERETFAERTSRIDRKVSVATLVLGRLSPLDPKARLLGSALLRRDEVLLDALLGQMTDEVVGLASERPRR